MSNTEATSVSQKLLDFDWQLKYVIGSSSLSTLEEPLAQITFHCATKSVESSAQGVKSFTVELNKLELKNLLSSLQKESKDCTPLVSLYVLKHNNQEQDFFFEGSAIVTMGLPTEQEGQMFARYKYLCADLNLDSDSSKDAWQSYLSTRHNYTLEGNPMHWFACAIYVACRSSTPPAVGLVKTFIDGNQVSLSKLLFLCDLTLMQFIDKCRKWINMVRASDELLHKIEALERKFAVTTLIYKKFKNLFSDMFIISNQHQYEEGEDKLRPYRKNKGILCTSAKLMKFTWTLYLVVKSEFLDTDEDLVSSYHLLLACCDLIYANAIHSDRRDILNRMFSGVPEHYFDDDYDPPSEPICIIDELCRNHEGIPVEAKSVKEYNWKSQIKRLFDKEVLIGESYNFTQILTPHLFDFNYQAVNKAYEQYVLSVGDFDERVMLTNDQSKQNKEKDAEDESNTSGESHNETPSPSVYVTDTLTPLTNRQYLRNRDAVGRGASRMTPVKTATESVNKLYTMLRTKRMPLSETLRSNGVTEAEISDIEKEIQQKVNEMEKLICPHSDESPSAPRPYEFTRRRLATATQLFTKLLDDIATEEARVGKSTIGEALRQDAFVRALFSCAVEIVAFAYNAPFAFPRIINVFGLPPFHFYKVIELVVRTEMQLTQDMVKHLNMIEEKVLDSLSWTTDSPLWKTIADSNMPVPSCEDACLPSQLSRYEELHLISKNNKPVGIKNEQKVKPKRGGSLGLFFRKFYTLASIRMQELCSQLSISDTETWLKMWTCFEYVIVNHLELMKNRHLDHIIMCTVYVVSKVLEINLTFQEIMRCYRNQPQATSHIYRNVLLSDPEAPEEERGDLIKFYNKLYVKTVQTFALRFSSKTIPNRKLLTLSPLPVARRNGLSPFRRISEKHSIFIRCLNSSSDGIMQSPHKSLSYYFSRSPAKDLHAMNNRILEINAVKRNLNVDDGLDDPPRKRPLHRNGTTKLQDMMDDRRGCKS